jgi:hypothetical protein
MRRDKINSPSLLYSAILMILAGTAMTVHGLSVHAAGGGMPHPMMPTALRVGTKINEVIEIATHENWHQSIVGLWSAPGGNCNQAEGQTTITPMSLQNNDISCTFRTVRRIRRSVVWKGSCSDAEGNSKQTVTASENKGVLTIEYQPGGNVITNMVRCKP